MKRTVLRLGAIALVLAALIVAAAKLPVMSWIEPMQGWFQSLGFAGVLLYGFVFFLIAMVMAPCMPLALAAGVFFGTARGALAVVIGTTLAAAAGFLIGRTGARGYLLARMRSNERFTLVDEAIRRKGWLIVGLLRMCPVPFGITNYLYGLTAVAFWHYLLATVIGMLPGNILFPYLGAAGLRTLKGESAASGYEWVFIAMAMCAFIGIGLVARRIARETLGAKF